MNNKYSRARLVQQPGGKQCVGRDETELVAERVCAIKASLAPGRSFDRAQMTAPASRALLRVPSKSVTEKYTWSGFGTSTLTPAIAPQRALPPGRYRSARSESRTW
jgi:hypothetical protein